MTSHDRRRKAERDCIDADHDREDRAHVCQKCLTAALDAHAEAARKEPPDPNGCGGPLEACLRIGCEECGTQPVHLRETVRQYEADRDQHRARADAAEDTARGANLDAARERERADGLQDCLDSFTECARSQEAELSENLDKAEARVRELEAELTKTQAHLWTRQDAQRWHEADHSVMGGGDTRCVVCLEARLGEVQAERDEARAKLALLEKLKLTYEDGVNDAEEIHGESYTAGWRAGRDAVIVRLIAHPSYPRLAALVELLDAIRDLKPPTEGS